MLNLALNTNKMNNFTSYMLHNWNNKYYVRKIKLIRKNWIEVDVKHLTSFHQVSKQVYRYLEMKEYMLRLQANKRDK